MNERVENREVEANSSEGKTTEADLKLQESQRGLGLYPEEKPFVPSLAIQTEGLDRVGTEVKDKKIAELEKAKVTFAAELGELAFKTQVNLDRTDAPTMDSVDLNVELGEVSAAVHLPQASLFQTGEAGSANPEVTFKLKGKDLAGSLTFQSEQGQPGILKGEFATTDGFKFKIAGTHDGKGGLLVQSAALEKTFAVEGGGDLKLKGGVDFATGAKTGGVEYSLNF